MTRTLLNLMALGGVLLVAPLVACSSDAPEKFASSDSFCSSKAEAECNNLAAACGASVEACTTARTSACNSAGAAAANQGRAYRANAAQSCIDKTNEVFKEKVVTAEAEASVIKVCERVFSGAKKVRESCANTFECEGSLICDGVCTEENKVSLNGGCANAGDVCAEGTYCQAAAGTGKMFCVEKNKLDQPCGATDPCIESLRCVNRCTAKVAVGQPCDNDSECAQEAPYCDAAQKKCRPKYQAGTAACKEYGSTL